ncbi:MAG TPA: response regulator [Gammaproteobacteria bacterium]|nr:response regulator [Gammaproteobacteria bacterium]
MSARILVVDDEPDIRVLLKDILEDEGYQVYVAEHARAANEIRRRLSPDLVLLDIWMPEVDGVTLLKQWKSSGDDRCPVVMMSGHGTVETAVEATRYGAVDFVEKPLSMAKLLSTVKSALASSDADPGVDSRRQREVPVGTSQIVQNLKQKMEELRADSRAVLFTGAYGSGRRIWAEYLSTAGGMDIFEVGGNPAERVPLKRNLYIEEITDLSPQQQANLYDAIKASNRDSAGRFIVSSRFSAAELKSNAGIDPRLAELWRDAIEIPSLDEHIEDIPELLEYYVNWYSDNEQLPYRHFDVAAQNLLRNHHWSGDINQLKQFIRTILENSDDEEIGLDEIQRTLWRSDATTGSTSSNKIQITIDMDLELREARETFEREYLSRHLAASGNNMTELARRVGQERTHLYRKLKSLGLQTKKQ